MPEHRHIFNIEFYFVLPYEEASFLTYRRLVVLARGPLLNHAHRYTWSFPQPKGGISPYDMYVST